MATSRAVEKRIRALVDQRYPKDSNGRRRYGIYNGVPCKVMTDDAFQNALATAQVDVTPELLGRLESAIRRALFDANLELRRPNVTDEQRRMDQVIRKIDGLRAAIRELPDGFYSCGMALESPGFEPVSYAFCWWQSPAQKEAVIDVPAEFILSVDEVLEIARGHAESWLPRQPLRLQVRRRGAHNSKRTLCVLHMHQRLSKVLPVSTHALVAAATNAVMGRRFGKPLDTADVVGIVGELKRRGRPRTVKSALATS